MKKEEIICNMCGEDNTEGFGGMITINIKWGYASIGKDTTRDYWHLCYGCYTALADRFALVCSYCNEKIRVVVADLHVKRPGVFYTNIDEVLECRKGEHTWTDSEFGKIGNWTLCEPCYEEFVLNELKIPIQVSEYHPWNGLSKGQRAPTEPLTHNRVEAAIGQKRAIREMGKHDLRYPLCLDCDHYYPREFIFCPIDGHPLQREEEENESNEGT